MKREPLFSTETALCAAFIAWAHPQGWVAYPETAGWDILLVGAEDVQIGVQAKLKFNLKVISQTAETCHEVWWNETGPDFRAVLIPAQDHGAEVICGALGIQLLHAVHGGGFAPGLDADRHYNGGWHFCNPVKRHSLPAYVPDVAAGSSGPVQLTKWKIAALRICAVLELRGHVSRSDFKRYGLDARRWIGPGGWLVAGEEPGQFVAKSGAKLFGPDHPVVYPQIRTEVAKTLGKLVLA